MESVWFAKYPPVVVQSSLIDLTFQPIWSSQPWDLPEILANNVDAGSYRGAPQPGDVICLVKRFISSGQLSQSPLLVLPQNRGHVDFLAAGKCLSSWFRCHVFPSSLNCFSYHSMIYDKCLPFFPSLAEAWKQPFRSIQKTMLGFSNWDLGLLRPVLRKGNQILEGGVLNSFQFLSHHHLLARTWLRTVFGMRVCCLACHGTNCLDSLQLEHRSLIFIKRFWKP